MRGVVLQRLGRNVVFNCSDVSVSTIHHAIERAFLSVILGIDGRGCVHRIVATWRLAIVSVGNQGKLIGAIFATVACAYIYASYVLCHPLKVSPPIMSTCSQCSA